MIALFPHILGSLLNMKRKPLTRLQRVRIFDAANGRCCLCPLKIHAERGERWEAHHVVPLWLGGADDPSNMAPAHKACHDRESASDNPERAKTDRMRANYLGIEKPNIQPLPFGKRSGFKKTMRGEVVARVSQNAAHRAFIEKRRGGGE